MPIVASADKATEIAVKFLKEYYPLTQRPISAAQVEGKWTVDVNVGLFLEKVATVVIDADSGDIIKLEVPTA